MNEKQARREFPKGVRVAHVSSGRRGTVVGNVRPMRSAGNTLWVRVEWDSVYRGSEGMEWVERLVRTDEEEDSR